MFSPLVRAWEIYKRRCLLRISLLRILLAFMTNSMRDIVLGWRNSLISIKDKRKGVKLLMAPEENTTSVYYLIKHPMTSIKPKPGHQLGENSKPLWTTLHNNKNNNYTKRSKNAKTPYSKWKASLYQPTRAI